MTALVSLLVALAAAPVPKEPVDEVAQLQGKWRIESWRVGEDVYKPDGVGFPAMVYEFNKDDFKITSVTSARTTISTGKIKYDTVAKTITLTEVKTVDAGGKPVRGDADAATGYLLAGGKLVLAGGPSEKGVGPHDPAKPRKDTVLQTLARFKD